MINILEVSGFKKFAHGSFKFAPLTILTGANGSGKTSLIQGLLLAWEASTTNTESVRLNGPFGLQLGTAADVLNWQSEPPIKISLGFGNGETATWYFEMSTEEDLFLRIKSRPKSSLSAFSIEPRRFTYLSAERLGPRHFLGTSPVPDNELEVGAQGEYCAHVLSAIGNNQIEDKNRLHPARDSGEPSLLKYEVEKWLAEIARPVEITAERHPGSSVAELKFRSLGAEFVRAPNMGFGISYTLPVVLGGLIARAGGILVVENPEAHLHPAGQSRMGIFLAWLAGKGVQVVLETHSDHIVNGIRRAIAEHEVLTADKALAHFFGPETDDLKHQVSELLSFTEIGSISHWPRGFFDQYQIDISSLGQIRRKL